MIKVGVLISGRGSNLQAIIDASEKEEIPAQVVLVISNKPAAFGLERAKKHGIPTMVLKDEAEMVKALREAKVDLVCLAGYMRIVGKTLLDVYQGKMINIHPSLLPKFPGLHAQRQALQAGAKESGVTVHFVDEGCDTGPIILQAKVPVRADDTEETLSARILEQEHKLYPQAIKLLVERKRGWIEKKMQVIRKLGDQGLGNLEIGGSGTRQEIHTRIKERLDGHCEKFGLKYSKFALSNARRRWGSCTSKGNIRINWRLINAPVEVLDYVIIHELMHLLEHNHSKRFWRLVEERVADYKKWRKWLRAVPA